MEWTQAFVAGTSPSARSRHTTTPVGSRLFVLGGGDDSRVYNDLFVLDTGTLPLPLPLPTRSSSLAGLTLLPPDAQSPTHGLARIPRARLLQLAGDTVPCASTPGARVLAGECWRVMVLTAPARRLYVFGGHDGSKMLGDLHVLDIGTSVCVHTHTHDACAGAFIVLQATALTAGFRASRQRA